MSESRECVRFNRDTQSRDGRLRLKIVPEWERIEILLSNLKQEGLDPARLGIQHSIHKLFAQETLSVFS